MRIHLGLLVLWSFQISLITAQDISPDSNSSIDEHLTAVNSQWSNYNLSQTIANFSTENQRIQQHFIQVVKQLESADVSLLSQHQLDKRTKALHLLAQYGKQGLFPKNDFLPQRTPVFKDHHNTSCAVAHLMEKTGGEILVGEIQREANYTYLEDLAAEFPSLNKWAKVNGFSVSDLALIQPGYPPIPRDYFPFGSGGPVNGKVNVMVSDPDENLLYVAGKFSEIDGVAANNIIAWDGEDWQEMGSGVIGEIYDMAYNDVNLRDKLIIAGDFYLEGKPEMQNVAYWDDGEWYGLQLGEMEGAVRCLYVNGSVSIGGDFKKVNGEPMAYLARGAFVANQEKIEWENSEDAFSVNGPVNVITRVDDKILVGGSFTETAPDVDSTFANQLSVSNVAFWSRNNWVSNGDQMFNEIHEAAYLENRLYLSDNIVDSNGDIFPRVHVLSAGFWSDNSYQCFDNTILEDQMINGFFYNDSHAYVYGNIRYPDDIFAFVETEGFMSLESGGDNNDRGINFDGLIRAVEKFQNKLYFAGDFLLPSGPYDGLVATTLFGEGIDAVVDSELDVDVDISCHDKILKIQYEDLSEELALSIYSIEGQFLDSFHLSQGTGSLQKDLSSYNSGVFVYQIHNDKQMSGGKISVF